MDIKPFQRTLTGNELDLFTLESTFAFMVQAFNNLGHAVELRVLSEQIGELMKGRAPITNRVGIQTEPSNPMGIHIQYPTIADLILRRLNPQLHQDISMALPSDTLHPPT